MDDSWFRWVIGGLVAFYTAVTSWLTAAHFKAVTENITKFAELDRRVALMEARVYIDPVNNAKVLQDLTNAITNLNSRVGELRQQITELEELIREQKRGLSR